MAPTLRCLLLATLGVPVSLAAALVSERLWTVWLALAAATALLIALDALLSPPRRRMRVTVTAPPQLYVGEADPLTVALAVRARRPLRVEVLVEVGDAVDPPAVAIAELVAGAASIELPLVPHRRGRSAIEAVWLRWRGPFGLLQRTQRVAIDRPLEIVPNVRAIRAAALRMVSDRSFLAGLKQERYVGDGSEFDSLVEYMPGLDHRAIDWTSSARHRKLLCQEFRAERNHQVVVGIDTGHLMAEPLGAIPTARSRDQRRPPARLLRAADRRSRRALRLRRRAAVFAEPAGGVAAFPGSSG